VVRVILILNLNGMSGKTCLYARLWLNDNDDNDDNDYRKGTTVWLSVILSFLDLVKLIPF
jgi:hypothetical protein